MDDDGPDGRLLVLAVAFAAGLAALVTAVRPISSRRATEDLLVVLDQNVALYEKLLEESREREVKLLAFRSKGLHSEVKAGLEKERRLQREFLDLLAQSKRRLAELEQGSFVRTGLRRGKTDDLLAEVMQTYADAHETKGRDDDWAYAQRRLNWQFGGYVSADEWGRVMEQAVPFGYNSFDAKATTAWLKTFPGISIEPARAGSVALYVKGPKKTLETMMKGARKATDVDEVDFEPDGTLRLWWD